MGRVTWRSASSPRCLSFCSRSFVPPALVPMVWQSRRAPAPRTGACHALLCHRLSHCERAGDLARVALPRPAPGRPSLRPPPRFPRQALLPAPLAHAAASGLAAATAAIARARPAPVLYRGGAGTRTPRGCPQAHVPAGGRPSRGRADAWPVRASPQDTRAATAALTSPGRHGRTSGYRAADRCRPG